MKNDAGKFKCPWHRLFWKESKASGLSEAVLSNIVQALKQNPQQLLPKPCIPPQDQPAAPPQGWMLVSTKKAKKKADATATLPETNLEAPKSAVSSNALRLEKNEVYSKYIIAGAPGLIGTSHLISTFSLSLFPSLARSEFL
jgi:hypothetical protein